MNDLDIVRERFDHVREPSQAQLAAGRDRLLASIAVSPRGRHRQRRSLPSRHIRRLGLVAAGAATVAAAAVALRTHPSSPAGAFTPQIMPAAQVLRAAASTDAAQPSKRPGPRQWIYSESVERDFGQPVQTGEEWTRFDGQQDAYLQAGQLVVHTSPVPASTAGTPWQRYAQNATPMSAYDALASLPTNSSALLRVVDSMAAAYRGSVAAPGSSPSDHHQSRQQLEFQFLATLLWNASQAAPAKAEADVFRAIATIPGVTAQQVTDALGRPAIGLSDIGDEQQLLLDPGTYQVTGLRTISDGTWPVNVMNSGRGPTYAKGTVLTSLAWQTIHFVSRPGQR